jgi:hypothetical protein
MATHLAGHYKDGDYWNANGEVIKHVRVDPNGPFVDDDGTRFYVDDGFSNYKTGTIPPPAESPQLYHGQVQAPPPVPGGADHPGEGVTAVNTEAMKTFAANVRGLIDHDSPLRQIAQELPDIKVKAGGFRSAMTLADNISGSGKLIDATVSTLQTTIQAIATLADAVHKIAVDYENHEDANKMTSEQYSKYLGQASTLVNRIDSADGGTQ